ncbi:MAG TPA: response regulator [Actinomycetota bacterium]
MRRSILVVENDPMSRRLAERVLTAGGYDVACVGDAETALESARTRKPDLVLMDVRLPGMDGLEATRRLLADPATADVAVAALSAQAFDEDVRSAMDAGCVDYLTKPIGARELLERVSEIIGGSGRRKGSR